MMQFVRRLWSRPGGGAQHPLQLGWWAGYGWYEDGGSWDINFIRVAPQRHAVAQRIGRRWRWQTGADPTWRSGRPRQYLLSSEYTPIEAELRRAGQRAYMSQVLATAWLGPCLE